MRSTFHLALFCASLIGGSLNAAAPSGVHSFLNRVIAYETSGTADLRSPTFLSLLTPRLRSAVQVDMAGQDVGVLDHDPICQCQDDAGLAMRVASLRGNSPTTFATLEIRFGQKTSALRLKLSNTPHGWRIADVATSDEPSLLRQLERANRNVR